MKIERSEKSDVRTHHDCIQYIRPIRRRFCESFIEELETVF